MVYHSRTRDEIVNQWIEHVSLMLLSSSKIHAACVETEMGCTGQQIPALLGETSIARLSRAHDWHGTEGYPTLEVSAVGRLAVCYRLEHNQHGMML